VLVLVLVLVIVIVIDPIADTYWSRTKLLRIPIEQKKSTKLLSAVEPQKNPSRKEAKEQGLPGMPKISMGHEFLGALRRFASLRENLAGK
jgi:hypothetical protein